VSSAGALARSDGGPPEGAGAPPRWVAPAAAALVAALLAGLVIGGIAERPTTAELGAGASAGRLTTASSNRYEYWRVGIGAFAREPLSGVGAGGFRVVWLQERTIDEAVRDAHSLPVELAAELGLPGLLAFALAVAGVAAGARRALRRHRDAAAGCLAALLVWSAHACVDWDWQLPAVTLPAIALAGALLALAETSVSARPPGPAAVAPPARAARSPGPTPA
jgi:O-antigen ligase